MCIAHIGEVLWVWTQHNGTFIYFYLCLGWNLNHIMEQLLSCVSADVYVWSDLVHRIE